MDNKTISYLAPPEELFQNQIARLYPQETINKRVCSITIQVTEDCCMACTYCYQNKKSSNKMSFDTAKVFIDDLLADKYSDFTRDNIFGVIFDFIGGEPLMEINLIKQIVEYTITQMILQNHPWLFYTRFSIGSNGLLYNTSEVQDFFNKYGSLIGFTISIDGNKNLHDACRVDLNGQGTYDRAIAAVHNYNKHFGNNPSTKMTIAPENVQYLFEAVLNLIKEGYQYISLNCVYEDVWKIDHAKILYNQLKLLADYLINNNLYNKIYVRMFDEKSYQPMIESDNENWCGGVNGRSLAINYLGNLYPCIRYMEHSLNGKQKPITVGDIVNGYGNTTFHKKNLEDISNVTRRSQSTDECFYCPIAKGCAWCSAYNYEQFGTVNKRATYICNMHQATALANVYYWNTLYQYLNIDKVFHMHIPETWALNIIDQSEYNNLKILSKEEHKL